MHQKKIRYGGKKVLRIVCKTYMDGVLQGDSSCLHVN